MPVGRPYKVAGTEGMKMQPGNFLNICLSTVLLTFLNFATFSFFPPKKRNGQFRARSYSTF